MERGTHCPVSDRGHVMVADERATPAGPVVVESCIACQGQWWYLHGEQVDRHGALAGVAATRRR